ncbi:MAG: cysteine desulfurase family protein [Nanoarchaeota archaeon]
MKTIYFDNAATTPLYKEVEEEMKKYLFEDYGNPSSIHFLGERSRKALDSSRTLLARELGAKPHEIIFTSGATESNNLAIQGLSRFEREKKKILISSIEHPSVYNICNFLKKYGYEIISIPVNSEGILDLNFLSSFLQKNSSQVLLVSIIHVNNVLGVCQDLKKIGELCKKHSVPFHTDAAQSFVKIKINVRDCNITFLSASAHKIGGPKGAGFIYIKEKTDLFPLFFGGHQEKNLRSGTENVPSIVGFAKALEVFKKTNSNSVQKLRDYLFKELEKIGGKINGSKEKRIFNNVHVSFPNKDSEYLVLALSEKGICVSSGSACDTRNEGEDNIFKALNIKEKNLGSIRISLSEKNTKKEVDFFLNELKKILRS